MIDINKEPEKFDFINKNIIKKYAKNKKIDLDNDALNQIYKNSNVDEMFKKPKNYKKKMLKIWAPAFSFQCDVTVFWKYKNHQFCLTFIDIQWRYAFMYLLKNKTLDEIIYGFGLFIKDLLSKIKTNIFNKVSVSCDSEFNKERLLKFLDERGIRYFFFKSKDIHLSKYWNPLAIVDRFTRWFKNLLNKYLHKKNSANWPEHINFILNTYNELPHSSLNYNWPEDIFLSWNYEDYAAKKHMEKKLFNLEKGEEQKNKFNIGDTVRILEQKNIFDKETKNYSREIYKIIDIKNGKYTDKYKLADLQGNEKKKLYNWKEIIKSNASISENEIVKDSILENKKINLINRRLKKEGVEQKNIIQEPKKRKKKRGRKKQK